MDDARLHATLDCMDVTRNEVLEAACTQLTTEREVLEQQTAIAGSNDDELKKSTNPAKYLSWIE
jgi:hypothetical protein